MKIAQMTGQAVTVAPRAPRTNIFVMATVYSDSGSAPVRVRNLSPSGALIEGPVLPVQGTRVRLSRGSLNAMGYIVWHKDGRAGLHFESSVSVANWLPQGRRITAQQRVDEIVQQAKATGTGGLPSTPVDNLISQSTRLAAVDLRRLGLAIQSLAEDFAADPTVLERYGAKLQTLDIAAQTLRRLAAERWP